MTGLVVAVFAATYLGMLLGRIPGLRVEEPVSPWWRLRRCRPSVRSTLPAPDRPSFARACGPGGCVRGPDPRPHLLALAEASNAGSAAGCPGS